MIFASDNWAGASDRVVEALAAAAAGPERPYGADTLSDSVSEAFDALFEREVAVFFVASGTAANALALAQFARPGGVVFCHEEAHIVADEGGAPEFLAGIRLAGIAGRAGTYTPGALRRAMTRYASGSVHSGQPAAVSLSQISEAGAVWRPDEIAAIAAVARESGLPLHMDGARFGNAVAALGVAPAEITWRAGVDLMSFGATKNGCFAAEAVVFFDKDKARGFEFVRKRSGHLFSKSRFVAAQFSAYLADGHWLDMARHANAMAAELAAAIVAAGGRLAAEPGGNELFAVLPKAAEVRLREAGARFYAWPTDGLLEAPLAPGEVFVRLVTSFRTTPEEVARFSELLAG